MSSPAAALLPRESQQPLNPWCSGWAPSCWASSLQRAGGLLPTPRYFWFTLTSASAPSPSQEPLGWREPGARHAPPVTFKAGAAHSPRAAAPSHPGPQAPEPPLSYAAAPGAPTSALRALRGTRAGGGCGCGCGELGVSHNALFSAPPAAEAGPHHRRLRPLVATPAPPAGGALWGPQAQAPLLIPRTACRQGRKGSALPAPPNQPVRASGGPPPGPCVGQRVGGPREVSPGSRLQNERLPSPPPRPNRFQRKGVYLECLFIFSQDKTQKVTTS